MPNITPNLWFDHNAEEAARFYASIFPNSRIGSITHYGPDVARAAHMPEGSVMTVEFTLDGNPFLALNGGPMFKFSEAISFIVNCEDQNEIDFYWDRLSEGGQPGPCGWLKDRFGLSWQIVPSSMSKIMAAGDATRQGRLMSALMQMKKLDIAALMRAYDE